MNWSALIFSITILVLATVVLLYSQIAKLIHSHLADTQEADSQYGLVPACENKSPASARGVDIILVSGLGSNPATTWRAKARRPIGHLGSAAAEGHNVSDVQYVDWVRDFLAVDLREKIRQDVRIYYYNNNTHFKRDSVETRLSLVASDLLNSIKSMVRNSIQERRRDIVFVGHSYGGLIIKQALSRASGRSDYDEIAQHTKALALRPLGSNPALLNELKYDTDWLIDLDRQFQSALNQRIQTTYFFEKYRTLIRKFLFYRWEIMVVNERSAAYGCNSDPIGLDLDHTHMNKFESRDRNYEILLSKLEEVLQPSRKPLTGDESSCLQTLRTTNYEEFKDTRNPKRLEQTCQWLFNDDLFQKFRQSQRSELLWISAEAGCGKSVICKSFVDQHLARLRRNEVDAPAVCYFFFKDDNNEQKSVTNALSALLHQLFELRPWLIHHAMPEFQSEGAKLTQSFRKLWAIFKRVVADAEDESIICVLDALDECPRDERVILLRALCSFYHATYSNKSAYTSSSTNMKFVVFSRPQDDIRREFIELTRDFPNVRIQGEKKAEQISEDVDYFIDREVMSLSSDFKFDEERQQILKDGLKGVEHRTYLWADLINKCIRQEKRHTKTILQQILTKLPQSVDEAYENILGKIEHETIAKRMLSIIIAAAKPLTLAETNIAHAIKDTDRNYEDIDLDNEATFESVVRNICGSIVIIADDKLYLLHQTAREFLLSDSPIVTAGWKHCLYAVECEAVLARACVSYLLLSCFQEEVGAEMSKATWVLSDTLVEEHQRHLMERLLVQHKFLYYSATHWCPHFRRAQECFNLEDLRRISTLYYLQTPLFLNWSRFHWNYTAPIFIGEDSFSTRLGLSSFLGHWSIVALFLKAGDEVDAVGGYDGTALASASAEGHARVVRKLLDNGANVAMQVGYHGNAMGAASAHDSLEIVQILLNAGAPVNTPGGHYGSALGAASARGSLEIVLTLVNEGAPVNVLGGPHGSALQAASASGHAAIVQLLLERRAQVNVQGGLWGSALQAASSIGHIETVQILLARGAQVNMQGGYWGNALQAACYIGHVEVVQILLRSGALANARGGPSGNALQAAASQGRIEVVQILLRSGALVNAQSESGATALITAVEADEYSVVEILLQNGATIEGDARVSLREKAEIFGYNGILQLLNKSSAEERAGLRASFLERHSTRIVGIGPL